jgi:hypothetical protein
MIQNMIDTVMKHDLSVQCNVLKHTWSPDTRTIDPSLLPRIPVLVVDEVKPVNRNEKYDSQWVKSILYFSIY